MRLIGSVTSPYVRFVRVSLAELGLEHEFVVTGPFAKMRPEDERAINTANPLMKVPVLSVDGTDIIDSRVIVGWLLARHAQKVGGYGHGFPESLQRENLLSVIYGVLEAGILRFIMQGSHPEVDLDAGYMARSLERVQSGLDWLDRSSDLGAGFGPPEALLVCGLEWMRKRRVYDWSVHPRLVETHQRYSERESLVSTRIPDTI
jgi:glutathione S-transferase